MRLKDKVVLVTASTRGIGLAIVGLRKRRRPRLYGGKEFRPCQRRSR